MFKCLKLASFGGDVVRKKAPHSLLVGVLSVSEIQRFLRKVRLESLQYHALHLALKHQDIILKVFTNTYAHHNT